MKIVIADHSGADCRFNESFSRDEIDKLFEELKKDQVACEENVDGDWVPIEIKQGSDLDIVKNKLYGDEKGKQVFCKAYGGEEDGDFTMTKLETPMNGDEFMVFGEGDLYENYHSLEYACRVASEKYYERTEREWRAKQPTPEEEAEMERELYEEMARSELEYYEQMQKGEREMMEPPEEEYEEPDEPPWL